MNKQFDLQNGQSVSLTDLMETLNNDIEFQDWENEEHQKWEALCTKIYDSVDDDTKIRIALKMLKSLGKIDMEDNGTIKAATKILTVNLKEFAY